MEVLEVAAWILWRALSRNSLYLSFSMLNTKRYMARSEMKTG
jgi:hypothetical protein